MRDRVRSRARGVPPGRRCGLSHFDACLPALSVPWPEDEIDALYEILVDTDAWEFPHETARTLIRDQPKFEDSDMLRALFAERFPDDPVTRTWYAELERWFLGDDPGHTRHWRDSLAVAVAASPPAVLPTIIEHAHEQLRRRGIPDLFAHLTAPLVRRLRNDPDAVTHVSAALRDPYAPRDETPIWRPRTAAPVTADDAARRSYLHARILQRVGALDSDTAASMRSTLLIPHGDVVTQDPFTTVEANLRTLCRTLTIRQR
ncbi:hypothetical protein ACUOFU_11445 [Microbacterium arabinogalactanolyticum]|uniref:hypothetical protein n=1 Tax=Microbacterium arabinogalactanolyticum TaxID=69365 RepID=UPI004044EE89